MDNPKAHAGNCDEQMNGRMDEEAAEEGASPRRKKTGKSADGRMSEEKPGLSENRMESASGQKRKTMKTEDPWLLLDNQLCFATYALSREIIGLYRPFLERMGLTYTQYITLMVLWETPEMSMKMLGERLLLDSGTLTPLLKKLVRMGFVEKERDDSDERSVIVRLTAEGKNLRALAAEIPPHILCGTGLDAEEASGLRDQMKSVVRRIQRQK